MGITDDIALVKKKPIKYSSAIFRKKNAPHPFPVPPGSATPSLPDFTPIPKMLSLISGHPLLPWLSAGGAPAETQEATWAVDGGDGGGDCDW